MSRRRLVELARGLLAFVGLVALVLGVPALLVVGVGWPLPHAVPSVADLHRLFSGRYHPTDPFYLRVVAVVAWIAWFEVAACAVAEVRAALNGRRAWRVRFAGPLQPLIASLVTAVVLALPLRSGVVAAHGPSLAVALSATGPSRRAVLVAEQLEGAAPGLHLDHSRSSPSHDERVEPVTVTVRPRDTLWGLAERYLGNPLDWKEIFHLNVGKPQPGGGTLTDPSLIRVGWVLELPARAAAHVPAEHQVERHHRGVPSGSEPTSRPSAPHREPTPPGSVGGNGKRPVPRVPPRRPHDVRHRHNEPAPSTPPAAGPLVQLPSGAAVSASFLAGVAAAVAMGRLRRRRRYRPRPPVAGWSGRGWEPPPPLATLLRAERPVDEDDLSVEEDSGASAPAPRQVEVPPGHMVVGQSGDDPVIIELAAGGLGLDGPGAEDAARAIVADVVTRHEPGHLECVVEARVWNDLLGEVEPFPGLRRVDTLDDFVREAEVELIRRVRLLEEDDLDDLDAYWQAHPEDPMPILLLVCRQPSPTLQGRIAGVIGLGRRVGITALIFGAGSISERFTTVSGDGFVDASSSLPEGARLVTLGRREAQAALEAVAVIRRVEDEPDREETPVMTESATKPLQVPQTTLDAPVQVQLLGSFRILVGGEEVRTGMRMKARELLAWFCCHPEGGTPDAVVEALWPEIDPNKVSQNFWNAVTSLRGRLREASGVRELRIVDRSGSRYSLVDGELAADLWKLELAFAGASGPECDADRTGALEQAASLYRGDLAADCDWLWIEVLRSDLRCRTLDVLCRLAMVKQQEGDNEQALEALEQAIGIDPYAEELYERKIRLLVGLGRASSAHRTFEKLTVQLDEIGLDPSPQVVALASEVSRETAAAGEEAISVDP